PVVHYELSDNSDFEDNWAVAARIGTTSRVVRWHCSQCGRADYYPAGSLDVTLEGGADYPDLLGCGAYPLLIVSERTVSVLEDVGINSFIKYPVDITNRYGNMSGARPAPNYNRIEITGECRIDLAASGIVIVGVCGRCGAIDRQPLSIRPLKLIDG